MSGLWVVISREYKQRVHEKSYIATTVIGLIIIIGLAFLPAIIEKFESKESMNIAVLEETGQVTRYLDAHLQSTLPDGQREFAFKSYTSNQTDWANTRESLVSAVNKEELSAFLEIFPPDAPSQIIWHAKKSPNLETKMNLTTTLQQMETENRAASLGLSLNELGVLFAPVNFTTQIEGLKSSSIEEQTKNMALVYFLLFMLYFALIIYGIYVATGVAEEKSNRVMEMMLVSVKPTTLMAGKIIGIGAAGLTQFSLWIASGLILWGLQGNKVPFLAGFTLNWAAIEPVNLIYFGVFFILGFLLYAALYAGLGCTVNRIEDVNQAVGPITILIVIGFMVAISSLGTPDTKWMIALSYVPFFTPMLLFERIVLTNVPGWSIALGISELVLTTVLFIWLAGKIYRVGVLMYGKMSWQAVLQAIRSK